jgi:hypothetical protein
MFEWLQNHEALLTWLGVFSVVMFVGTLLAVPWLAVRIPADYFRHHRGFFQLAETAHPLLHVLAAILKNLAGVVFIVLGLAMLVLPGQGILTILFGLVFLDFPGKFSLETRFVRVPVVHRAIDWMRKKAGVPPLDLPEEINK